MLLNKIVVAEDDDSIAHMVNMALGDAGFLCLRARDGEEALRLIRSHLPDLLVLDIMMPRLDGHEVARRVKADVMLSKTPILMLTALGEVDQKVMGFESGADDYMTKPFDLREFNARVKALIRAVNRERARNPTTHLPGSGAVEEHVEQLLRDGRNASVIRFDAIGFDAFTDQVGFARAEELVVSLSKIILEGTRCSGAENSFVGHLGGVDFVVVCPTGEGEKIAKKVIADFAAHKPADAEEPIDLVAAVVTTEGADTTEVLATRMAKTIKAAKDRGGGNSVVWSPEIS